ncbi:MAG: cell division protein FtsZ [Hyphomicrobium sp.]
MSLKLQLPKLIDVKPRLTVIGVGGAGCNAVNNMIAAGLQGVDFVVANTDAQSLAASSAEHRIQLGSNLTEGLGAGSRPEIGEAAAEEAIEEIRTHIVGAHMVFIAAGMGGGTGTGAAAVIARAARELGVLTVGIVTKPFQFEGSRRMRIAEAGVQTLRQHVDTMIVIPNQNLFRIANERTTFAEAFVLADQVLYSGVACIVDLVLKEGLINLDFADVRTVMSGMGTAMMGTGEASGDRRAILAAEEAIANPLLDDVTLKGARGLLLSITGGRDLTLYEVDEAASRVREEVDPECNIIVGATFDENLGDRVRVSIVASGMRRLGEPAQTNAMPNTAPPFMAAQGVPPPGIGTQGPRGAPQPGSLQSQIDAQRGQGAMAPPPGFSMQPPIASGEDMQRRLSEALMPAQAPASMTAAMSFPGSAGLPIQPIGYAPHQPMREGTPGNVTIEEGFTPFAHQGPRVPQHYPPHVALTNDTQAVAAPRGFEPQPPAEIRRSARRMPGVDDLPAVGQREWNARQNGSASQHAHPQQNVQPNDESRKKGFFDRLTGLGRRPTGAGLPGAEAGNEHGEGAALPVFFGRERR